MKPILAISEQSHQVLGLFLKIRNICIGFSAFLPMIYFWFLRNLTCCLSNIPSLNKHFLAHQCDTWELSPKHFGCVPPPKHNRASQHSPRMELPHRQDSQKETQTQEGGCLRTEGKKMGQEEQWQEFSEMQQLAWPNYFSSSRIPCRLNILQTPAKPQFGKAEERVKLWISFPQGHQTAHLNWKKENSRVSLLVYKKTEKTSRVL